MLPRLYSKWDFEHFKIHLKEYLKIPNKYLKTNKDEKKLALWDLKTFYKAVIIISMIEAEKSTNISIS